MRNRSVDGWSAADLSGRALDAVTRPGEKPVAPAGVFRAPRLRSLGRPAPCSWDAGERDRPAAVDLSGRGVRPAADPSQKDVDAGRGQRQGCRPFWETPRLRRPRRQKGRWPAGQSARSRSAARGPMPGPRRPNLSRTPLGTTRRPLRKAPRPASGIVISVTGQRARSPSTGRPQPPADELFWRAEVPDRPRIPEKLSTVTHIGETWATFTLCNTWGRTSPHLGMDVWTTSPICGPFGAAEKLSTGCPSCPPVTRGTCPHPRPSPEQRKPRLSTQSTTLTAVTGDLFEEMKRRKTGGGRSWGQRRFAPGSPDMTKRPRTLYRWAPLGPGRVPSPDDTGTTMVVPKERTPS